MKLSRRALAAAGLLLALLAVRFYLANRGDTPAGVDARGSATVTDTAASGEEHILRAFEARLSDQWVESAGEVERVLPDDDEGSRHQRFILRLPSGHTVLVSHNIDLAERIDGLSVGEPVAFRGEYEWNARGGVVHWTHHDPAGRRPGGWLEHDGRRYR